MALLGSLIMHGKIKTTEAKAKEIKGRIDKIITKAKKAAVEAKKVAVLRDLKREINEAAAKKLTGELIGKFAKRNSGYARIIKLGSRKSDNSKMAMIELIED